MNLLWSSLSLKHLAGTIKAVLVQTQPYVHLMTEVSFQSAEVFGGTSVKGWEGFPSPSAQQVLFLSDPCVVSRAEPGSSCGTISVRCCSKGLKKKSIFAICTAAQGSLQDSQRAQEQQGLSLSQGASVFLSWKELLWVNSVKSGCHVGAGEQMPVVLWSCG